MKQLIAVLVLSSFPVWGYPCGKEGSIEDRVKECNLTKDNFVLVTRDEKNNEIYKDTKSGLIWGTRIPSDFNHYGSSKACSDEILEKQLLKDLKWRLPSIKEFEQAASHGMKAVLPNMNHWFWTSTPVKMSRRTRRRQPAQVFIWNAIEEVTDRGDLKDGASVRCVAKP